MQSIFIKLFNLICFMVSLQAQAQQNIHTAGGNTSSSAGSVAYSVGQIVYNTHSNAANIISEGVQQPYEISVITANEKIDASYIDVHVYPNPSSQCIKLNVGQTELSKLSYQLSDAQGKLLENKQITSSLSEIAIQQYATNMLFVKVLNQGLAIKTFKIIKK